MIILDAKALPYSKFLKDMRVVDKYTLVMDLTEYSNQLVPSWGWWPCITSKAAWDKASSGDLEKGKEWARSLDVADPGRFFGTIYNTPPGPDNDLAWWISTGRDPNYLLSYMRWFSTQPFTDLSYLAHTPEQAKMDSEAQKLTKPKDQAAITGKPVRLITDNAVVIPVYDVPGSAMQQPWVHSTQYEQGFARWQTEEVWMERH